LIINRNHIEKICAQIVDSAFSVHSALGPGLLERVYQVCLAHELSLRSIPYEREVSLNVKYKGLDFDSAYRLDLLVSNEVIVELKSVEKLLPVHNAQLLSYLRLMNKTVGFLINFNVPLIKDGIHRIVNRLPEQHSQH
jgi:GxxExxY protein